ncbi:fibrinogen-related protein 3-2 [Plakobranchus ocellatus]|uniref:Fibrinogen-related protein 3-2 n=1 Tax=Plakobranchus ocellatus TaxID=259542 RepID=A0AAV3Z7B8_9GAST|nr:fibrinogen-related protein 3-2 [Plakobranchus ocellatus]
MEKVLSLMFLMGIISGGNGLQFSLNRHVSTATEKRAACGVLTCEESDTYQTGSTITKMSVFKHKQSGPVTSDKPEGGNLMASVTLEQPLITRESDGVKIDGRLEAGRASLRLELFTKEDCSAEFTCEVRMLDSQEKESINTYHLLQYSDQSANQVDESIATPAGSLQLLLLFQQLDTKLAMMGSSLESKIGSVENRLEDKIASLYDHMESTIEKRIMDKLHQMDNTLSSFDEAVNKTKFSFPFLCDTITDGGGWIVIQRRTTGNVDFYRDWAAYKKGFGSLDDDFWLGNDNIHTITSSGTYELRVDLKFQGKSAFAHYSKFSIDGEDKNYGLRLGDYDGTAGNPLSSHNGQPFSTFDRDNDKYRGNCAEKYSGAWWYHSCQFSNLNGKWKASNNTGPRWSGFSGSEPVSYSEMKIRELRDN